MCCERRTSSVGDGNQLAQRLTALSSGISHRVATPRALVTSLAHISARSSPIFYITSLRGHRDGTLATYAQDVEILELFTHCSVIDYIDVLPKDADHKERPEPALVLGAAHR
jgi:hypothetical protein